MKAEKAHYSEIDTLKAIAALLVMLTHVLAEHMGRSQAIYISWELIHFSVGMFVIISGFLAAASEKVIENRSDLWSQIVKRTKRIVLPYYIYVLLFLVATLLAGKLPELLVKVDMSYIFETIFLVGGVGYTWIPRLFLMLSIVLLLLRYLGKFNWLKYTLQAFIIFSLGFSIYSQFVDFHFFDLFTLVFGWFLIFMSGYWLQRNYSDTNIKRMFVGSLIVNLLFLGLLVYFGRTLSIFHNERPPTPFFISFNIACTMLIWLAAKRIELKGKVKQAIVWLGNHAYELFFYHLIFLYIIFKDVRVNIFVDFVALVLMTVALIWVVEKGKKLLTKA